MTTAHAVLQLKPGDEVGVALRDIHAGEALAPFAGFATAEIPFGHKVALRALAKGDVIQRLGQPIGLAQTAIALGAHVHLHNLGFEASMAGRAIGTRLSNATLCPIGKRPRFQGFVRDNGKVATRNYVGVLTSVNCSALVDRRRSRPQANLRMQFRVSPALLLYRNLRSPR